MERSRLEGWQGSCSGMLAAGGLRGVKPRKCVEDSPVNRIGPLEIP